MGDHVHDDGGPFDCESCGELERAMHEEVFGLAAARTHAVGCMCPRCSHAGAEPKHITLLTEDRVREIVREEIAEAVRATHRQLPGSPGMSRLL